MNTSVLSLSSDSKFKEIRRKDKRTITFTLAPSKYPYANTLRRAMMTEVPILGFRADMTEDGTTTDVKVFKNTTPMSNEMLADRVGLLPIMMPSDLIGEDWSRESVLFKLHVKNETDTVRYVTASDFECIQTTEMGEKKRIPNTKFFHPDPITGETCLIAVLKEKVEGQEPEEIHLEAYATLGKGKEHARFIPTSQCTYMNTLDSTPARIQDLFVNWLQEQKKVNPAELEKNPDRKKLLEREFRSLEIYRCTLVDSEGEPYSFDFTVESVGTMEPYAIIAKSFGAISNLCNKYAAIDKGTLPENLEIMPADARMKGFDFHFMNEDHTLGNLLQTWLDENKVGRGPSEGNVTFAGYKVPHPLEKRMVLRIGVEDGKEATARLALAQAAKGCADMFADLGADFVRSTASMMDSLVEPSSPRPISGKEPMTVWEAHKVAKKGAAAATAAAARGKKA